MVLELSSGTPSRHLREIKRRPRDGMHIDVCATSRPRRRVYHNILLRQILTLTLWLASRQHRPRQGSAIHRPIWIPLCRQHPRSDPQVLVDKSGRYYYTGSYSFAAILFSL
jgi:hypothetical protein